MYQSFGIKNFRCFDDFKLDGLNRINLFAGKNDVGKTTLLEALFIHSGAYNANHAITVNTLRGFTQFEIHSTNKETPLNLLFKDFDLEKHIEFKSKSDEQKVRKSTFSLVNKPEELNQFITTYFQNKQQTDSVFTTMDITQLFKLQNEEFNEKNVINTSKSISHYLLLNSKGVSQLPTTPPPFETMFFPSKGNPSFNEEANRFGKVATLKKKDQLIRALQIIEPRIKNIEQSNFSGLPLISVDIGLERLMQISVMGQGLSRMLSFVLGIMNAENGVILIDEIENGIYFENLPPMWKYLMMIAETFNVQVFATTHSLECINAAFQGIPSKRKTSFNYIRLDRKNGQIIPTSYDKESFETTMNLGLDVR
jgi:AAA15 family ATPase/GTPase